MKRRAFLELSALAVLQTTVNHFTLAIEPNVAVELQHSRTNLDSAALLPRLKVNLDDKAMPDLVRVEVQLEFIETYCGGSTKPWSDADKSCLEMAATKVSEVWSSDQFRRTVCSLDPIEARQGEMIDGVKVYRRLSLHPRKLMRLAYSSDWWARHWGHENAATCSGNCVDEDTSSTDSGETRFQVDYLRDSKTKLPQLVNTLSHECTHYCWSGSSADKGHSQERSQYVSYAIGCITQHLAFPGTYCGNDDPTALHQPASQAAGDTND